MIKIDTVPDGYPIIIAVGNAPQISIKIIKSTIDGKVTVPDVD
jgi:hypothetical protein